MLDPGLRLELTARWDAICGFSRSARRTASGRVRTMTDTDDVRPIEALAIEELTSS
ncbi:MAG: hypothetical protein HC923_10810 [Myxococcales bacterium]|nr:hypothetical protein [Myxococcales bacterium]